MATTPPSSSPPSQQEIHDLSPNQHQLLLLPAPPQPPSSQPSSRRLPPPCWTHDETVALIDSYREKWYSLRRSNLKATHWQDVANGVGEKCPLVTTPPKTAVQCRHKMEKLRKRYRTEIQRAKSMPMPISRFTSSWVHFKRMDCMEKGPQVVGNRFADSRSDAEDDVDDDDRDEDDDLGENTYNPIIYNGNVSNPRNVYGSTSNGIVNDNGSGIRIRLSNGVSIAKPGRGGFVPKNYADFDQNHSNPNSNFGTRVSSRDSTWAMPNLGKRSCPVPSDVGVSGKKSEGNGMDDLVSAIKVLGDAFVKMEQTKMEMSRQIETMRMEMEMKRTEMILESQERIVEAFANAVSETNMNTKKKKAKTMP